MKQKSVRQTKRTKVTGEFVPCAPEMAYCTDCGKNRALGQCPRIASLHHGGRRIDEEPERLTQKKDQHQD